MREPHYSLSVIRKKWDFPGHQKFNRIFLNLSLIERIFIVIAIAVFAFSSILMLWQVNNYFLVEVPARGGVILEGVIGTPRAINPLLADDSSEADKDLTILIYSGLLKATPNGDLVHDLAQSYNISENGLVYEFTLKDDIYFHNGEPVTAEDVAFTVKKAQDPLIKSPMAINWEGVIVEVLDSKKIKFTLPQPYSPFLENTTLGILPKHLWNELGPDQFEGSLLNFEPIGSGPYKIKKIKRGSNGLPIHYELKAFNKYALGEPNITNIFIRFYFNEKELIDAFEKGHVENINSISPETALSVGGNSNLKTATLTRIFGVFFNQNQASLFTNREVRRALDISLDKQRLVEEVLDGYGKPIHSPLPPKYSEISEEMEKNGESRQERIDRARQILRNNGWILDEVRNIWKKETGSNSWELSFSIATSDANDLKKAAELIKEDWEELGASVNIEVFDLSDLKQNIIRPRKYDALLFGTLVGRDLDLFPFWHSSQRSDPGLNISSYVNAKADKILEDIRNEIDRSERIKKYHDFEELIAEDLPTVFAYSPEFIYLVPQKIKNVELDFLTAPDERFLGIHNWYIETNNVWEIFN